MKEEYIRERQAVSAHDVMQQDLRNKNKNRIRKLHELVDPDYKKLRRNRQEKLRPSWGTLDTIIYYDILDVICESLKESSTARKQFIELYSSSYPNTERIISKIRDLSKADALDYIADHIEESSMNYVVFVIGDMEEFNSSPIWATSVGKDSKKKDMYYEVRRFYSQQSFYDTRNSILKSDAYIEYLNCNRRKLAEYLNCKEAKLSAEINNIISKGIDEEKDSINNGTPEMTARIERKLLMAYHQGGGNAFLGMQLKNPSWFKSYYYKPDVDHIIDDYYAAKVITESYSNPYKFRESTFVETFITETPQRDLEEILMLCNADIIYKMYDVLMDQYYESFSWDKKYDETSRSMIASQITTLENDLELSRSQNAKLRDEISLINKRVQDFNDNTFRSYEEENRKLRSLIEDLEKQNQQQKEIIDAQTDLIESIQRSEDEIDEDIDVSRLQSFRYLFAGFFDTYLTELKSLFPNSVFMTNATKDISGVKVDYIIIVTKYISHSMYYKVKGSVQFSESPCLMCNASSVKGVLNEINRFIDWRDKH